MPWAVSEGITEIIGNPAEVTDGRVTGRCGYELLRAGEAPAAAHLPPERDSYTLFAYGDGRGAGTC